MRAKGMFVLFARPDQIYKIPLTFFSLDPLLTLSVLEVLSMHELWSSYSSIYSECPQNWGCISRLSIGDIQCHNFTTYKQHVNEVIILNVDRSLIQSTTAIIHKVAHEAYCTNTYKLYNMNESKGGNIRNKHNETQTRQNPLKVQVIEIQTSNLHPQKED
jgi:hypothetical protein